MIKTKNQSVQQKFANTLADRIPDGKPAFSKSGVPLFFSETEFSHMFCDKFGISDVSSFNEAFYIATGGVGKEIDKINSVASSALLPLLIFHPLYKKGICQITINLKGVGNIVFDKVFFEVRNKVIGLPSCVDVVLQSTDGETLLFLESKLSEYIESITNQAKYGKTYLELYNTLKSQNLIGDFVISGEEEMIISTPESCYIEGIKQSISHLIGLVQGPQDVTDSGYPKEYLDDYKTAYENATRLLYGTILFNPSSLGVGIDEYSAYRKLYGDIIGMNGNKIVEAIKAWPRMKEYKGKHSKTIEVLNSALSYQEILKDNPKYCLPEKVKAFYGF